MSKEAKVLLAKYGGSAVFVGLMAYFYISVRDFAGGTLAEQFCMISDALTIPGMLLLLSGALVWVSNLGALDGIGYVLSLLGRSLVPGGRAKADEKYADYVERKRANSVRGYGFLFISGGITTVLALVFIALFFIIGG